MANFNKLYAKQNGIWKIPQAVYYKSGGSWVNVQKVYHKEAGIWRRHWPDVLEFESDQPYYGIAEQSAYAYRGWSPLIVLEIPNAVQTTDVAHITGGYLRYASYIPSDGDDSLNSQSRTLYAGLSYSIVPGSETTMNTIGTIWIGPVAYASSGAYKGTRLAIDVPNNYLLTGLAIQHYNAGGSDDSPGSTTIGFQFYLIVTPASNAIIERHTWGGQIIDSKVFTTFPGSSNAAVAGVDSRYSVSTVYVGMYEGGYHIAFDDDDKDRCNFCNATSTIEFGFNYYSTRIK
jgi:hypothetical protein